jgi:tetratricopeptide (TPR) repeat protein
MKISFLLFALSVCITSTYAQGSSTSADMKKEYMEMYRQALEYNDFGSAAYALTGLLRHGGEESYKDTLAVVYYNLNNLNGAYKLAGQINKKDEKNITALTLLADISSRAGEVKTSLEWYEKLCGVSPGAFNHYQLATKQFILERNLECRQSLQKVVADSAAGMESKVRLDLGDGYAEEVPVLAAAMNMLGALAYKEKNTKVAEEWYTKAIAVHPDFVIAKQNLEEMKKEQTPPAKTTSPPAKPTTPVKKG